jgi:hypothetical protein
VKGLGAAPPREAKVDGVPRRGLCALSEDREANYCHAGRWLKLTETGLDPAAFAVVLASFKGNKVKREPRRLREVERGPG